MKCEDLQGRALDWAVAKANDHKVIIRDGALFETYHIYARYNPSVLWSQGGPIIERERITLGPTPKEGEWYARSIVFPPVYWGGPTPLIAAMRCFVAYKLGPNIEIPKEILE